MNQLQAADIWLKRGAELLPVQPRTKYLAPGYGLHMATIKTLKDAGPWWSYQSNYNIAVILPPDILGLDFDDEELYYQWLDTIPSRLIQTYQETSPRGWHVFYHCRVPEGLSFVKGVEVKKILVVSPSQLRTKGQVLFTYQPISDTFPIIQVQDYTEILSSLLSEPLPEPVTAHAGNKLSKEKQAPSYDLIKKIKEKVSITEIVSSLTELSRCNGREIRWLKGKCPLPGHKDNHPSFWVDTQRGLWGCYACGVRGDVINLYAKINQIEVTEAIQILKERV